MTATCSKAAGKLCSDFIYTKNEAYLEVNWTVR